MLRVQKNRNCSPINVIAYVLVKILAEPQNKLIIASIFLTWYAYIK